MKDLKSVQKTGARLGVGANKGGHHIVFELKRTLDYCINLHFAGRETGVQRKKVVSLWSHSKTRAKTD